MLFCANQRRKEKIHVQLVLRTQILYNVCVCVHAGLGSASSSHWDLLGNTMITPEYVRLTPDLQSRQGAVWSRIVSVLRINKTLRLGKQIVNGTL